jgi:pyruvate,water dikinase
MVGQAAYEVGRRLVRRGVIDTAEQVRLLHLDEVTALVVGQAVVDRALLDTRSDEHDASLPLPARFQVSDRGLPIAVEGCTAGGGVGAGGGIGEGAVTHDASDPPQGSVLVVEALTPTLGPVLPRLSGLVSETGSVLSHLAILAREAGVPTVVGRHGAAAELEDGTVVKVDGQTGDVTVATEEEAA